MPGEPWGAQRGCWPSAGWLGALQAAGRGSARRPWQPQKQPGPGSSESITHSPAQSTSSGCTASVRACQRHHQAASGQHIPHVVSGPPFASRTPRNHRSGSCRTKELVPGWGTGWHPGGRGRGASPSLLLHLLLRPRSVHAAPGLCPGNGPGDRRARVRAGRGPRGGDCLGKGPLGTATARRRPPGRRGRSPPSTEPRSAAHRCPPLERDPGDECGSSRGREFELYGGRLAGEKAASCPRADSVVSAWRTRGARGCNISWSRAD